MKTREGALSSRGVSGAGSAGVTTTSYNDSESSFKVYCASLPSCMVSEVRPSISDTPASSTLVTLTVTELSMVKPL